MTLTWSMSSTGLTTSELYMRANYCIKSLSVHVFQLGIFNVIIAILALNLVNLRKGE